MSSVTGVSIGKEKDMLLGMCMWEGHVKTQGEDAIYKPRREVLVGPELPRLDLGIADSQTEKEF